MTKKIIISLSILIVLFSSFVFLKLFGIIQYYTLSSPGNEPTIKANSLVFATNLIKPKKYRLVIFEQDKLSYMKGLWTQRLCGTANDRIEIRNGDLYVNDSLIDDKLTLNHLYLIDENYKNWLVKNSIIKENETYSIKNDTFLANLSTKELNKNFYYKKYIHDAPDDSITIRFNQPWNQDNFGPVTVPENYLFFLGDNRNNSLDSRYIGFIHKSKIRGTVLGYK